MKFTKKNKKAIMKLDSTHFKKKDKKLSIGLKCMLFTCTLYFKPRRNRKNQKVNEIENSKLNTSQLVFRKVVLDKRKRITKYVFFKKECIIKEETSTMHFYFCFFFL